MDGFSFFYWTKITSNYYSSILYFCLFFFTRRRVFVFKLCFYLIIFLFFIIIIWQVFVVYTHLYPFPVITCTDCFILSGYCVCTRPFTDNISYTRSIIFLWNYFYLIILKYIFSEIILFWTLISYRSVKEGKKEDYI